MDLNEHTDRFTRERIDGEILSECDEDVLRLELGITNKTQLAKIIKVISGVDSVKTYTTTWLTETTKGHKTMLYCSVLVHACIQYLYVVQMNVHLHYDNTIIMSALTSSIAYGYYA